MCITNVFEVSICAGLNSYLHISIDFSMKLKDCRHWGRILCKTGGVMVQRVAFAEKTVPSFLLSWLQKIAFRLKKADITRARS